MATKEKQAGTKGGKKKGGEAPKARGPHAGAGKPVPPPRAKALYDNTVRAKLAEQFGLTNPHQIPTLTKIVLNVGAGEAIKQPKFLDTIVEELATITGQQPVRRKAKKSIANFGLREGQDIGASVTLRGARMWEFFDRFVTIALPRVRDFRGVATRSFDGRGNYTLGVRDHVIFPEIDVAKVDKSKGMNITIVTTAKNDEQARFLLRELGMPFGK
jgi:large subunit ribosomal protein L5